MGKPTEEELHAALQEAARMREQGDDPHHMGKVLLNLNYRLQHLERVCKAVEHYLHSGLAEREHTRLIKALEKARQADRRSAGEEGITHGLE